MIHLTLTPHETKFTIGDVKKAYRNFTRGLCTIQDVWFGFAHWQDGLRFPVSANDFEDGAFELFLKLF